MGLEFQKIQSGFQSVIQEFYGDKDKEDWIAIDGKTLKNTLTNYENESQNRLIMVSWFSPAMKLVIRAESFESKQGSENAQVRFLTLRLDNLHNQIVWCMLSIPARAFIPSPGAGSGISRTESVKSLNVDK